MDTVGMPCAIPAVIAKEDARIIDMISGEPLPDLDKCISCYCCQELCPEKAISINKHWLHRLLFGSK